MRYLSTVRPKVWGKTAQADAEIRLHAEAGEHVHQVGTDGSRCWNGHDGCPTWVAQGRQNGASDAEGGR